MNVCTHQLEIKLESVHEARQNPYLQYQKGPEVIDLVFLKGPQIPKISTTLMKIKIFL